MRHQRDLRHRTGLDLHFGLRVFAGADLGLVRAPLLHQLVHQLHAHINGFGGGALQVRIKRGVDAQRVIVQLALR